MDILEQVNEGLEKVTTLVNNAKLEPNPQRRDWPHVSTQRNDLAAELNKLFDSVKQLRDELEPDQADRVCAIVGAHAMDVVAVLLAAQASHEASTLLTQIADLSEHLRADVEAAQSDPNNFVLVTYGQWLTRQGRNREAKIPLKQVLAATKVELLRNAATEALHAPKPLKRAPPLFRFNGFGVGLYGSRDPRSDNSHVSTYCLSAVVGSSSAFVSIPRDRTRQRQLFLFSKSQTEQLCKDLSISRPWWYCSGSRYRSGCRLPQIAG